MAKVIQWYWFGQGQTYESCVDLVISAAVEDDTEDPEDFGDVAQE